LTGIKKEVVQSEIFQRKRRNVVRDWLYFIVWYVRLKKILEQHKKASSPPSIADMINLKGRKNQVLNHMKSPMQDATQLTYTTYAFGIP